jgi:hypothetical protein
MSIAPKKISFSSLTADRIPLIELDLGGEFYHLYPPAQMNTQGYTRYLAASRIISKTIRETDKEARKLVTQIENAIDDFFVLEDGKGELPNRAKFSVELKELLIRPDAEDRPDTGEDDKEPEETPEDEISDKKKFTNLVSNYIAGTILNDVMELYEEYSFTVQGLLTSPTYISYLNEAIEAAFDLPSGLTQNWGLAQLQEVQKIVTEAINAYAKEERKKEKAKKEAKAAKNSLAEIKGAEKKVETKAV